MHDKSIRSDEPKGRVTRFAARRRVAYAVGQRYALQADTLHVRRKSLETASNIYNMRLRKKRAIANSTVTIGPRAPINVKKFLVNKGLTRAAYIVIFRIMAPENAMFATS